MTVPDPERVLRVGDYDVPTAQQPESPHLCHHDARYSLPEADGAGGHPDVGYCHGWSVAHSNRGEGHRLLALALDGLDTGAIEIPQASAPLFASGKEAIAHSLRTPDRPEEAKAIRDRLRRTFPHIDEMFGGGERGQLLADLMAEAERWSQLVENA